MQDDESLRELANVYNIAMTKQAGFQAYRYSFEGLKEAIDNEIEIRR
jgi:diacylglycerol kinase